MLITKIKSRTEKAPAKYSAAERKRDEAVCLSRMNEKSISQKEFDSAFRKMFGV